VSVLAERLLAVHDALTAAELPHAFGGAVALGYCTGEPRATEDLDVNVFVTADRAGAALAALPSPVTVTSHDRERAERDGEVTVRWDQTPIDVFFDTLPIHRAMSERVRLVSFAKRTIPIVGCTELAVFKASFDRARHWADVEAMIAADSVDVDGALAWLRQISGSGSAQASRLASMR
jgi:hypothetical protein